jgi:hypothetical protein
MSMSLETISQRTGKSVVHSKQPGNASEDFQQMYITLVAFLDQSSENISPIIGSGGTVDGYLNRMISVTQGGSIYT